MTDPLLLKPHLADWRDRRSHITQCVPSSTAKQGHARRIYVQSAEQADRTSARAGMLSAHAKRAWEQWSSSMNPTKHHILRTSEKLGVEAQLRTIQRVLEPSANRRNRRDDENLRLLFAAVLTPDSNCIDVGANIGSILACMLS